jgi:hypothetical protein
MARNFLQLGNGRAKCQLCGEKIKTGIPQISHRAYQNSASFHANAKDCFPRSKLYIKKNGCPHCGVVDIDGIRKSRWGDSHECTHCYQPVSADKKTIQKSAEIKPTYLDSKNAEVLNMVENEQHGGFKWGGGLVMIHLTGLNSTPVGFDEYGEELRRLDEGSQKELMNRIMKRAKQRRSKRGREEAEQTIKIIKNNDFTFIADYGFNAEEPLIEEPDFIPNGDGRAIGQQNSSINLTPLHAESFNAEKFKKRKIDAETRKKMGKAVANELVESFPDIMRAGLENGFPMTEKGFVDNVRIGCDESWPLISDFERMRYVLERNGYYDGWDESKQNEPYTNEYLLKTNWAECKRQIIAKAKEEAPKIVAQAKEEYGDKYSAETFEAGNMMVRLQEVDGEAPHYNCPYCRNELTVLSGKGGIVAVCENESRCNGLEIPRQFLEDYEKYHWYVNERSSAETFEAPRKRECRHCKKPTSMTLWKGGGGYDADFTCEECGEPQNAILNSAYEIVGYNAEHTHWHNKQNGQFYGKWSKHKKNGQFSTHNAETLEEIEGATAEATAGGLHSPSSFDITWEDLQGLSSPSMPPNEIHFSESKKSSSIKALGIASIVGLSVWKGIEYLTAKKSLKQSAEDKRKGKACGSCKSQGTMRKGQTQIKNSEYSVGQVNPVEAEGQEDVMGAEGVKNPRHAPSPTPSGYPSKSLKMW